MLADVLQQRAAGRVHDALGHAGRAGGEQHVQRMRERQALERERGRRARLHGIGPGLRAGALVDQAGIEVLHHVRGAAEIGHHDDRAQRRQLGDDLAELVGDVEGLAAVVVAVAGDQHLGLDLAEAVEHALDAEIGRAGRPHRTDRSGGEHADDALGHVGHDGGHPVADAHAGLAQGLRGARDLGGELAPAHAALDLVLAPEHERVAVAILVLEQVLGEVQARARKEPRARHLVAVDEIGRRTLVADHAGEIPQSRPELARVLGRVAMQLLVVGEGLGGSRCHPD